VRLDGGQVGYVLPDDLEATAEPEPWVALLPVLDATTMGWKDRPHDRCRSRTPGRLAAWLGPTRIRWPFPPT
jgi:hypothetical protein